MDPKARRLRLLARDTSPSSGKCARDSAASNKGPWVGVASLQIVGSGHGQLRQGGVVRLRNWMEDQEAASSSGPQSAKKFKSYTTIVSCTSELAAHKTVNLHEHFLNGSMVNVNVHVQTTDYAARPHQILMPGSHQILHATSVCDSRDA